MTEQLTDDTATPIGRDKLKQGLELIHRNGGQLLRLINQLLDLAKANSESLALELIQGDIVNYLQYLTESFYSMAEGKQVRLVFYSEEPTLWMDYDEEKVQQIVYNLLSNALKFTPPQGRVVLHLLQIEQAGTPWLQLKVKDSGIGIAPEHLPRIFDQFYQGDHSATRQGAGTGIGLALTKELIELMGGRIGVESTQEKGSTFQVLLPIRRNARRVSTIQLSKPPPAALEPVNGSDPEPPAPASDLPELPLLLLIEDNADLVTYIQTLVASQYTVRVANDGQAGIDRALELVPDIIICDVMMPGKDGFEVCATLKSDERTSHIPIVLLTARATPSDRLEGLLRGADAYLTKPFRKKELQIRLEKLVELRKNLRRRYTEDSEAEIAVDPAGSDPERQFLQKLTGAVKDHQSDPDFGVSQLAEAVLMSQTQVYRKLKALTGKTPSQFIRSLRLHRGLNLLQTTELTISEIAYEVGFTDPNYFSRTFHQEFKRPPSDFRK
jgi:CheY-like chemotaxis protein